jgi:hypothetical protein
MGPTACPVRGTGRQLTVALTPLSGELPGLSRPPRTRSSDVMSTLGGKVPAL